MFKTSNVFTQFFILISQACLYFLNRVLKMVYIICCLASILLHLLENLIVLSRTLFN